MKYRYSLSLQELIVHVQIGNDREESLELLHLYFKGQIVKNSMIYNSFDPDLSSLLTVVFIKACTHYGMD